MRKVVVPLERDMKKAASSASFDPRKYLKQINFKKMTSEEALQVEAMAKTVNTGLYEIVKAKLSKRSTTYDVMIKARRCLQAIQQWNKYKNDEESQNNFNNFDFRHPSNNEKVNLEPNLHHEIVDCKDFDIFLKQHKDISRKQLIDHIIKVNYMFQIFQAQDSDNESSDEEQEKSEILFKGIMQMQFSDQQEDDPLIISQSPTSLTKHGTNPFFKILTKIPGFSFSFYKPQNKAKNQSQVNKDFCSSKRKTTERGFYEKNNEC